MVKYQQYQPAAHLSTFIECYWVYYSPVPRFEEEKLIPGGRVEMIFHFDSPFHWLISPGKVKGELLSRVHFMGQRDRLFLSRPTGCVHLLGVRFKPGGLSAFTAVPVSDLLNRMVAAADILGPSMNEWEERLYAQDCDTERVRLLDQLFSGYLRNSPGVPPMLGVALNAIRKDPGEISVLEICSQTGWYYKKLERAFKASVGYSPSQYCKIIRFNKAFRMMDKSLSYTEIGHSSGYYDQSHFIKDFYRYAGIAPGEFRLVDGSMTDFLRRCQSV
jgi:AraC-like DNA-binding protein